MKLYEVFGESDVGGEVVVWFVNGDSVRGKVTDIGEPTLPAWDDYNLLTLALAEPSNIEIIDMNCVRSVTFIRRDGE